MRSGKCVLAARGWNFAPDTILRIYRSRDEGEAHAASDLASPYLPGDALDRCHMEVPHIFG